MSYESYGHLFNKHFISSDPTHFTFPLETTASTEPRLALRQISSVNYVTGSNFKITFVSEKHMVEDDVLFTNHLVGK